MLIFCRARVELESQYCDIPVSKASSLILLQSGLIHVSIEPERAAVHTLSSSTWIQKSHIRHKKNQWSYTGLFSSASRFHIVLFVVKARSLIQIKMKIN
jgi:hypothetical protein